MKVLHVGKFFAPFRGGVENYMRDAMMSLSRQGIRCFAVVHRHEWSFRSKDDLLESDKVRFHVVRAGTWFKFMYTPFSPMFPVLMQRLIRLYQPDILHLHMPNPSAFWALLLWPARKIPWVVHWHADVMASSHDRRLKWFYLLYKPLEQLLLRKASAIVVTSEAYLNFSKSLETHHSKCHVVPLGLDPSRFHLQGNRHSMGQINRVDIFHVLAVGRLTYYKGFEYLVQAVALLSNIQLDIIGTGDQEKKLKKLTRTLGVEDQVSFHGELPDQDLHRYLSNCHCLCLPSIERTEAFGMVLLEAMQNSKATVVSDVPGSGMGWVVEHGKTGIKVEPADVKALAQALKQLQENPVETQAMGHRGRERYEQMFQIDQSTASLIKIYNMVLLSDSKEKNP